MKAIVALEELIKEDETHIKLAKKQLAEHETGVNKLSHMVKATAETSLEEASKRLETNRAKLAELLKQDIKELEKKERMQEAVRRKNYYHYQKTRLNRDITHTNDEKIEAMLIIDELPEGMGFEDDILMAIAQKSLKLGLSLHEGLAELLQEIQEDFFDMLKDLKEEEIDNLELLNQQICINILHFAVLASNIQAILTEEAKPKFPGFPKFEDWWIEELWTNHQAYFGLYKWKEIISRLCMTSDQKRAWEGIFANWTMLKKYIATKGKLAYSYNYAFDTVMRTYCGLEEELATTSLKSMEQLINKLTAQEDFTKLVSEKKHQVITPYVEFKRKKINYKDVKGKVP